MNQEPIKLQKAKVRLLLNQPFFATQLYRLPVREFTPKQIAQMLQRGQSPTAATDGKFIYYDSGFLEGLTVPQVQGVLAHELLHVTNLHHFRRKGREMGRWNEACDHAINWIVLGAGLQLPDGHLNDPQYHNLTAEEIYDRLPPQPPQPQDGSDDGSGGSDGPVDPGGCGGVMDAPGDTDPVQAQQEIKEMVAQATQAARKAGKLSGDLERLVKELLEAKIPWRETLARFLVQPDRNDYNFCRPNRRYLTSGFILPNLYSETLGDIWLFVDTSASIREDELNAFASEIQAIVSQFNKGVEVLYIDASVKGQQSIEPDETIQLKPQGGGGTDFRPGYDWLEKEGIIPTAVVYFIDGYCESYPNQPDYPVLWAIYGYKKDFAPPFGEVIYVD